MKGKPDARKLVIDKDTGYTELMTRWRRLSKGKSVFVGHLRSSGIYKPKSEGSHAQPITIAQIAAIQTFGTADGRIPPRDYMGAALDQNHSKIQKFLKKGLAAITDGKTTESKYLGLVGQMISQLFRGKITDGMKPALAASTIKAKGTAKSKPLIDTGQLLGSINFEVRDDKKK